MLGKYDALQKFQKVVLTNTREGNIFSQTCDVI